MENIIPDKMPEYNYLSFDATVKRWEDKHSWNLKGMYAFVSWKWVNPFAKWIGDRTVLEIMSGAGWLAYALRERGISIKATDTRKWEAHSHHPNNKSRFPEGGWNTITEVEKMNANRAITKYGEWADIVIISWPYMDDSAYHAIKLLHKINPDALIVYIGEWGGCTASEAFFEHFEAIEEAAFSEVAAEYQQWEDIHDRLMLGKYKP